jgi:hypothetical protein
MDLRELGKLYLFFRRYPLLARKATAQLLNDLAFAWRPLVVTTLASKVIVRNPRFLMGRMRVQKTGAGPIERQQAVVGSTPVRGKTGGFTFDGLYSLQFGRPLGEGRNRTLALLARGGDKRAKAKRQGKLMPGDEIPTPDEWDDMPKPSRSRMLSFMLRDIADNYPAQRFIIPRSYGMAPGLYKIKKRRGYLLPSTGRSAPSIQIIQHLGRSPRGQRFPWMQTSLKWLLGHAPIAKFWERAISRVTQEAIDKAKAGGA